jgi:hypothetical protein
MNQEISARVFLVGCPRSGTTLLQSLLGANTHIATYPESHFYIWLLSRKWHLSMLGIAKRSAILRWNAYLETLGRQDMQSRLRRPAFFVRQFSRAFVGVLDSLTLEQGKNIWLEKTPRHLDYIDRIERLVDKAKFVHIIRKGDEVIASLYQIGKEYSTEWGAGMSKIEQSHSDGAKYQNIDECISTWIHYTRLSQKYVSKPNHRIVNYSQLVRDPEAALIGLCNFLVVPFEKSMLINYPKIATQIVYRNEKWKASASKPIQNHGNQKFYELFDDHQRSYILERIPKDLQEFAK